MNKSEMRQAQARARARRRRNRRKRNRISGSSILGVLGLCFVITLLLSNAAAAGESNEIPVVLKTDSISIIQGEERPALTAKAICKGDVNQKLNEETGYTVQNLLDELNQGIGFSMECEGDGTQEGEFPIKAELTSEMTTPLYTEWFGKVRIDIKEGKLEVKNKYGEWDGKKFKRWDGSYVENDFVTCRGKTYYFGDKGERLTGWQEMNNAKYYFNKKGVMKTGWMETDDGKYYFNGDGTMHLGWLAVDDAKYYFGRDGKMLTGEQKIGARAAVFAKDGKLKSIENGVDPNKPMMALTFDDGPGPRTMELLEVLERYDAHATFFMQGKNVPNYGDAVKKMLEIGCELGNHSYDHPQLTKLDADGIRQQIGDTNNLIAKEAGQPATVMRPPYGAINDTVKANVGLPMILWSVDTLDWKTRNVQSTIDAVMASGDGDIILMHDIHTQSVDAAIQLIPMLIENGYQLVTISEMAEARGITLENGGKYTQFWKE